MCCAEDASEQLHQMKLLVLPVKFCFAVYMICWELFENMFEMNVLLSDLGYSIAKKVPLVFENIE